MEQAGTKCSLCKLNYDLFGNVCEEIWMEHMLKHIFDSGIDIEDDLVYLNLLGKGIVLWSALFQQHLKPDLLPGQNGIKQINVNNI